MNKFDLLIIALYFAGLLKGAIFMYIIMKSS